MIRWAPSTASSRADQRELLGGLAAMLVAGLFFAAMAAMGKALSARVPAMEVAFLRCFSSWLILIPLAAGGWFSVRVRNQPAMVSRCLAGTVSMAAYFWTLARLPLADAQILTNVSPLFTALIAWWLLKERPGHLTWVGLAIALVGTVVLFRPDSHLWQPASMIGLLGAALTGLAMTQIRELGKTEGTWTIVFWYMGTASVCTLPAALPGWVWPAGWEWGLVAGMGLTATAAQGLMTLAFQRVPAALASTVSLNTAVMAVLLGFVFFQEVPGPLSWIGGGLIVGGGMLSGMAKRAAAPSRTAVGEEPPALV